MVSVRGPQLGADGEVVACCTQAPPRLRLVWGLQPGVGENAYKEVFEQGGLQIPCWKVCFLALWGEFLSLSFFICKGGTIRLPA